MVCSSPQVLAAADDSQALKEAGEAIVVVFALEPERLNRELLFLLQGIVAAAGSAQEQNAVAERAMSRIRTHAGLSPDFDLASNPSDSPSRLSCAGQNSHLSRAGSAEGGGQDTGRSVVGRGAGNVRAADHGGGGECHREQEGPRGWGGASAGVVGGAHGSSSAEAHAPSAVRTFGPDFDPRPRPSAGSDAAQTDQYRLYRGQPAGPGPSSRHGGAGSPMGHPKTARPSPPNPHRGGGGGGGGGWFRKLLSAIGVGDGGAAARSAHFGAGGSSAAAGGTGCGVQADAELVRQLVARGFSRARSER